MAGPPSMASTRKSSLIVTDDIFGTHRSVPHPSHRKVLTGMAEQHAIAKLGEWEMSVPCDMRAVFRAYLEGSGCQAPSL